MLEDDFKHYIEHQDQFVEKYNGKVVVLRGSEVLGIFDSIEDAYWWSVQEDLLGSALIQKVGPGDENYSLTLTTSMLYA